MPRVSAVKPRIVALIVGGFVGTANVVAERVFSHPLYVARAMKAMHTAGQLRIAGWERVCHRPAPIYGPAGKPDALRPVPKPSSERCKKYRAEHPSVVKENAARRRQKRRMAHLDSASERKTVVSEWYAQLRRLA